MVRHIGELAVFIGDGDTDEEMVYIQSTECEDWVAFPIEDTDGVIEAIRQVCRREGE